MVFSNESKELIDFFRSGDYDKALKLAKKNLVLEGYDDKVISLFVAARVHLKSYNFQEAISLLETYKQIPNPPPTQAIHDAVYHLWIGARYLADSLYGDAFEHLLKSKKQFSLCTISTWWEEENLTYLHYNLGAICYVLNLFEDSKTYCNSAEKLAKKNNNDSVKGSILNVKGKIAQKMNRLEEAEKYFTGFEKYAHTPQKKCMYLHNMAELCFSKGNYERAIQYLEDASNIKLDIETYSGKILSGKTYHMLGESYAKLAQLEKAEELQLKASQIVGKFEEDNETVDELSIVKKGIYESLCQLYTQQKQYEKAYHYSQKVIHLQTKELNYATDGRIAALRIRYEKQDTHNIVENFNQKVEELEGLNTYLSQIANSISHDVRAPLRNTISYLGLLEYRQRNHLDDEAQEYIQAALQAAKDAEILTKSLSDLGKINLEQKDISIVSIADIIQRVRRNLEEEIEQKNVHFHLAPLPEIAANEGQMLQLFQNLIANAIKYNESEKPLISIIYEKNTNAQDTFSIIDNGIGIAPENQHKIFQIFKRLHGHGEYEGMGIGLAICSLIVEKHNGKIWVESDGKNGTTFKFTINIGDQFAE